MAEASERSWDELVELLDALGHVGAIAIRARVDAPGTSKRPSSG